MFWSAPSMVTLVAPDAAVALAVAVPLADAVAVAVPDALELDVEDLSLEQPAKPPTTITAPQAATNRARFTTVLLLCCDPQNRRTCNAVWFAAGGRSGECVK
jgi:hypothetical protein